MKIHTIPTTNTFYQSVYNFGYLSGPNTLGLKSSDAWPAMCYSHGITHVPLIFNMQEQIDYIIKNRKVTPSNILEIGGGIGELSCAFAHLGCVVDSVECNPSAVHYHRATYRKFFNQLPGDNYRLFISDLNGYQPNISDQVDTVVLVESIEHISRPEWDQFFQSILPVLKSNRARLVITNAVEYWPLGFPGDSPDHISLIDDVFYDQLSEHASKIHYRNKSHICLEF